MVHDLVLLLLPLLVIVYFIYTENTFKNVFMTLRDLLNCSIIRNFLFFNIKLRLLRRGLKSSNEETIGLNFHFVFATLRMIVKVCGDFQIQVLRYLLTVCLASFNLNREK